MSGREIPGMPAGTRQLLVAIADKMLDVGHSISALLDTIDGDDDAENDAENEDELGGGV